MRDPNRSKVYHAAAAGQLQPAALAIRMRDGAPTTFTQRLREITLAVDPDLHLRNIRGLDEALRSEQWISRLQAAVIVGVTIWPWASWQRSAPPAGVCGSSQQRR